MTERLCLRPFREQDLAFLDLLSAEPETTGPYVWAGFRDPYGRRRRWQTDGYLGADSGALAVVLDATEVAGIASWTTNDRGGPAGGCYEIGIALLPGHRGHGLGTAAQRLLVHHLFDCTLAHRLEAQTDSDNVAEQAALERIGFRREGVLRDARFRQGAWRDMVVYGLLRSDAPRRSAAFQ